MLEVPDVDFIRLCGVFVFALFYCHLDLCCGECYVRCLQIECVPIYVSVSLCVLCLTVLVNAFVICVGEVSVFSLKVMVVFFGCVGVLLASPCIVFQSICVLCL